MRTVRIFVSSPGDVHLERLKAAEVIDRVQGEMSAHAELIPYFWEHEPMLATRDFQENIPSPAEFEIVVCILWKRLGSRLHSKHRRDNGTQYQSGTEFEFEEAVRGWHETNGERPDILVYRRNYLKLEITGDHLEDATEKLRQYQAVGGFFDKWFRSPDEAVYTGAYNPYQNLAEFELKLYRALRTLVLKRLPKEAESARICATWSHGSPFRGLQCFDFEHGPVFYGRSRAIDEIIGLFRRRAEESMPFVLVFGSSGVGKSSLARAGVLPQLIKPGVIEGIGHWCHAMVRPYSAPAPLNHDRHRNVLYVGLARALIQALDAHLNLVERADLEAAEYGPEVVESELATLLETNPEAVANAIKQALQLAARQHQHRSQMATALPAKLVLVIDQMEELFTTHELTPTDRSRFVTVISSLVQTGGVWVLATLRSDFFPRCETIPELMRLKEGNGQYHLRKPEEYEISQMIRWPAAAAGLRFAEDVHKGERLEDLIRDAALANRESLPLLQFTLEELYQRRTSDGLLTLEAYREIGGLEGALAQRAESEWQAFAAEQNETLASAALDSVLKRLVTVSSDDQGTFARRWSQEVPATTEVVERAFIERFIRARLFVADISESGTPTVSLAHEALLRHWQRLQQWLRTNQEDLRTLMRVRAAAATWSDKDRSPDYFLQPEKPLAEAKDLLVRHRAALSDPEIAFIESSAEAAKAELERKAEEARQRAEQEAAHARALQKSLAETEAAKTAADSAAKRATTAKGEAEKLIQFMTFDLHWKLQKIGKLDLLKDVNTRVEAYYQVFGAEEENIESLRRRAAAAHNRGDILRGQGDLAGALAAHREGIEINERLLNRNPTDTERDVLFMHYLQIGEILNGLGRSEGALEVYQRPIEVYEALDPDQAKAAPWLRTFCLLLFGRAQVLASQNSLSAAAADYERAAEICRRQLEAAPRTLSWLPVLWPAQAGLGQVRFDQGDTAEAVRWHRAAVNTICQLTEWDSDSIGWNYDLVGERLRLGQILMLHGDSNGAGKELDAAKLAAERLVAHDATNARWKNSLAMTYLYRGDLFRRQNNSSAALQAFQQAEQILADLVSKDPQNAEFTRYQKVCRTKIGEIRAIQGQTAQAIESFERPAKTSSDAGRSPHAEAELQQVQAKIMAAEAKLRSGQVDAALMGYLEALPGLERLATPGNTNIRPVEVLGSLLAQLGAAFLAKGALQEAKEALIRCATLLRERLLVADAQNPRWQGELCKCEAQLGAVLLYTGDTDGALRSYLSASNLCEQLVKKEPEVADLQQDLSGVYVGLGNVLAKRGDGLGARQAFRAAIQVAQKLVEGDPDNALRKSALAGYWMVFGEALLVEKDTDEALVAFRHSHAIWEKLTNQPLNNPFWATQMALVCYRIGSLLPRTNRSNLGEAREMLLRCENIINQLKVIMSLNPDQKSLLSLCEAALKELPSGMSSG